MSSDPNDYRELRDKYKAGNAVVIKPKEVPNPMQMRIGIKNNLLTIEFARQIDHMQLSKAETGAFIKALVNYHNLMEQ